MCGKVYMPMYLLLSAFGMDPWLEAWACRCPAAHTASVWQPRISHY